MSPTSLSAHLVELVGGESLTAFLVWWMGLALLGLAFLPAARRLFPGSADGGYAAGKLLALVLASWVAWLCGSLGLGVLSPASLGVAVLAILAASASALWRARVAHRAGRAVARAPLRAVVVSEAFFALALAFLAVARSFEPSLATTEKFMDFAFVNAVLHAPTLPPPDPWYAGAPINYYYFGHFVTAFWIRLTGVAAPIGYNLMVATLFAGAATAAASFAFDAVALRRAPGARSWPWLAAGLSGVLVVAAGNLHPVLFGGDAAYHYSQASRFVGFDPPTDDKLITEFPAYSFLVADLHAHLLNLPFTLVFLHLLLGWVRDGVERSRRRRLAGTPAALLAASGFLLGTFWMTNTWDAPLYAGLLGLTLLLRPDAASPAGWPLRRAALAAGVTACAVAIGAVVCLPFLLGFEPFGRAIVAVDARTPTSALLILYGWQLSVALVWAASRLSARRFEGTDALLAALGVGALVCIATHELVRVEDGLPHDYRRANTVFKLGFQAFVLLSVAVGPMLAVTLSGARGHAARVVLAVVLGVLVLPPLRFLPLAFPHLLSSPLRDRATLDGLAQPFARNPGDAAIARWLQHNGRGQGHLLECYGASFGYGARMSVFTGIPSVVGWVSHEALWRPEEPVLLRRQAVAAAYTSGDTERVRGVLDTYDVGFVVVGKLERLVFPDLEEAPFRTLGEVVVEQGDSRLYRVRRADPGPGR